MERPHEGSQNRELVLYYIKYKLSQRNFPLNHLTLATPPNRTEVGGAAAARGHEPRATAAAAAATLSPHTNGTPNGTSLATPPPSPPFPQVPPSPPPASPLRRQPSGDGLEAVKEALRDSANEFELRFARAFSDLSSQLHITPATAYQSFESVMNEVFRDGVNWGRVVGLFAFGGALCVECVEKEMSSLVGRIAEWMTVYLDVHIQPWIQAQGGWERFSEVFGKDAAAESRRSQESFKKWLLAGMTLVTGVVVGSIFAQRRL
ncbi:hypothetical protein CRUP_035241 [Coryphaenoides rupestris]|nr:hypothetical protein CRUP_035241 [Coryphaenoides rupestris]